MKLHQITDGEWVSPHMRDFTLVCCDCSLRHKMQFKVVRQGRRNKVLFRAWRLPKK